MTGPWLEGPRGLPIFKPPYGRLVAIDLNKGDILWSVPNGDGLKNHPAFAGIPNLPAMGRPGRLGPQPCSRCRVREPRGDQAGGRTSTGVAAKCSARTTSRAAVLPGDGAARRYTGAPMSYIFDGKQYIVVATGWKGQASELVALALP